MTYVNELRTKLKNQREAGLILDLRNNPGGYLNDAVFIVSEFIDRGVVVIQEDDKREQETLSVSRRGILLDIPMIVLINKGSASASEITAGALRDHNRAKLLGENSFGKGTVQQAVDLDDGASVHISVAKWLTPNQTWVNKVGLKPDIEVAYDASASAKMKAGLDNQLEAAIKELLK
jgi:carboxyl-terminal processing protease